MSVVLLVGMGWQILSGETDEGFDDGGWELSCLVLLAQEKRSIVEALSRL